MLTCSKCHKENPDGLKFCIVCGHDLDDGLYGFLTANGLGEHLEVLRRNDLLSLADLLRLEEVDLRELKLPYGDFVRLRTAINALRLGSSHSSVAEEEPEQAEREVSPVVAAPVVVQPSPVPPPAAAQSKSSTGKIVAGVLGAAVLLMLLAKLGGSADPNKAAQDTSTASSSTADLSTLEAHQKAREAEQQVSKLREQAAQAERDKAEAQRMAAEREAESLREAARRAEQEKQEALQRANLAQQEAAMATAQQQDMSGFDEFFQSYINSLASNDPYTVANHYADTVEYGYAKSASGRASRAEIAEDNRKLFASYPQRSYSDIEVRQVSPLGPGTVRVNYGFNYQYNGKKLAMGSANVWATVERIGGRWQITRWSETVNRIR